MQEETEVLGENLRGQVWIENQIHIRLWPDWESNPGRIGERHGNNRCARPPLGNWTWFCCPVASSVDVKETGFDSYGGYFRQNRLYMVSLKKSVTFWVISNEKLVLYFWE